MKKMVKFFLTILLVSILFVLPTFADQTTEQTGIDIPTRAGTGLADIYNERAGTVTIYATIILLVLCIFALTHQKETNIIKTIIYILICLTTITATIYLVGSTIYINTNSSTKGPIHWHTDFELWNCGQRIDLKDPEGLSNRIGTPILHEHGDNRIHIEGVVYEEKDANIQQFFNVIGGTLTETSISIPTNKGILTLTNGETCPDGTPGILQAYLYHIEQPKNNPWTYTQKKLTTITTYTPAPEELIPPGDCLIITFGPQEKTTNHICETYKIAEKQGELYGS